MTLRRRIRRIAAMVGYLVDDVRVWLRSLRGGQ
jgi:hypothetical protein